MDFSPYLFYSQECKHQFKHRRFDCETVNDDSVFGPITSLGECTLMEIHTYLFIGRSKGDILEWGDEGN